MITWDEDDNAPGNQVATLVIADGVPPGFRSAVAYSHYSLLRTIELAWGLAPLTANDAGATVMSDFFPGVPAVTVAWTNRPVRCRERFSLLGSTVNLRSARCSVW